MSGLGSLTDMKPFQTNIVEPRVGSREQRIVELVRDRGVAAIQDLASEFDVTPQTIRRGVNRLSALGLLRRVHGGVTMPPANANLPWATREVQHLDAKHRIAAEVARMIPDGASVAIGLGTTPHQVALALRAHCGLRVVTNSLRVVLALAGSNEVEITVAGGTLRPADLDVVGEPAARTFGAFKTDFAIFGVGGIDADGSLLDFHPEEVVAREIMRRHSRVSVLVADASKFGRAAMARGGSLADVDVLVTDAAPAPPHEHLLQGPKPRMHLAGRAA
jgi:DeoR family glycerol-3-phosphate regulon repressor